MQELVALYVIINVGFADVIVDLMQEEGSKGATILPARGSGGNYPSFLGLKYEPEREIIISVLDKSLAEKIIPLISEKHGKGKPANALSYTLPVSHSTMLSE